MLKQYQKNIAESRNIIYPATIIAVLLRVISLSFTDEVPIFHGGILWNLIEPFFRDKYISFASSLLMVIAISLYVMHLNTKYVLIRVRTSLPYVFTMLLLSFSKDMAFMTPAYLSIILFLFSVDQLFDAYQLPLASWQSFRISFCLSLGSLLTPSLLIYIPMFWIGLSMMRSMSFKAFLASLLGILTIYWLALIYCLSLDDINSAYSGIEYAWNGLKEISVLEMGLDDLLLLSVGVITILIIIVDNFANSYKDKIRTRTNISFLNIVGFLSIAIYLFLALHLQVCLMVTLTVSGLSLSHFYALADKKWKVYSLIIISVIYLGIYFHLLLKHV